MDRNPLRLPLPLLVLFVLMAAVVLPAQAQATDLADMQRLYEATRPRMAQSAFKRPLVLDSMEAPAGTSGDIYAVLEVPLARLALVNRDPQRWCEIVLLLSNTKNCAVGTADAVPALLLRMGTKGPQELSSTTPMDFHFSSSPAQAPVVETLLNASAGPMGTKDGTLRLRAIAIGADRSFVHLHYSYRSSMAGRLATEVYLQTLGRGKVGFSAQRPPASEGVPTADGPFVGGVRGIIERNTMRYFLGLRCALQFAASEPPEQRFGQMAPCWYDETERYPLQLHEMSRQEYLDMKLAEYARHAPSHSTD